MPGTVSSIAKTFTQPKGGFLRPSSFRKVPLSADETLLHDSESISATLIGTVVDSMTRFMLTRDLMQSFSAQIRGIYIACGDDNMAPLLAAEYLNIINGLDDNSLEAACSLAVYETWYRNTAYARSVALSPERIEPDMDTLDNIRIMVNRNREFFEKNGSLLAAGFNFFPEGGSVEEEIKVLRSGASTYGGYTRNVAAGDGDYLTPDGLWDLKVSKSKITSKQTLQILMYWIMGQHSGQKVFQEIKRIGIINPRLNIAYVRAVDSIEADVITAVERDVIGY